MSPQQASFTAGVEKGSTTPEQEQDVIFESFKKHGWLCCCCCCCLLYIQLFKQMLKLEGGREDGLLVKVERGGKIASILSGIHYRHGGGVLWINPSDAFSVLLTFSLSPKRRVVRPRAFVKLNRRGNNANSPPRCTDRLSERVSCPLGGLGLRHHLRSGEERPPMEAQLT